MCSSAGPRNCRFRAFSQILYNFPHISAHFRPEYLTPSTPPPSQEYMIFSIRIAFIPGGLAIADCEVFASGWLKATCLEWSNRAATVPGDFWAYTSKVWAWLSLHVPRNYRPLRCIWPCPRAKTFLSFVEWHRIPSVPLRGSLTVDRSIPVTMRSR